MLRGVRLPLIVLMGFAVIVAVVMIAIRAQAERPPLHNTLPIATQELFLGLPADPSQTEPTLRLVRTEVRQSKSGQNQVATLLLINPLDDPLCYSGYRVDSYETQPPIGEIHPILRLYLQDDEDSPWIERQIGLCGNGLTSLQVPPKHAGRIEVYLDETKKAVKLDFGYSVRDANGGKRSVVISSPSIEVLH